MTDEITPENKFPADEPEVEDDDLLEDEDNEYEGDGLSSVGYRGQANDPLFGLLLAGAVSIGLLPLVGSDAADMRYTLVWGMLALFGVVTWLIGSTTRIGQENPENLFWGVIFGLILGFPLLLFGGETLAEASILMFPEMSIGTLLAYIIFVMPLGETLFFRGILQEGRTFWATALICTLWQMVLFFPLINRGPYPLVVGILMLMANLMYSYVRERNSLAAAWICQIVVNILLLFVPFSDIF